MYHQRRHCCICAATLSAIPFRVKKSLFYRWYIISIVAYVQPIWVLYHSEFNRWHVINSGTVAHAQLICVLYHSLNYSLFYRWYVINWHCYICAANLSAIPYDELRICNNAGVGISPIKQRIVTLNAIAHCYICICIVTMKKYHCFVTYALLHMHM